MVRNEDRSAQTPDNMIFNMASNVSLALKVFWSVRNRHSIILCSKDGNVSLPQSYLYLPLPSHSPFNVTMHLDNFQALVVALGSVTIDIVPYNRVEDVSFKKNPPFSVIQCFYCPVFLIKNMSCQNSFVLLHVLKTVQILFRICLYTLSWL